MGFAHVTDTSEEYACPMKETCSFQEVTKSPYEPEFEAAMEKEIKNHANHKHWTHCVKDEIPPSMMLRSTWKFKIKRNRHNVDTIKFEA